MRNQLFFCLAHKSTNGHEIFFTKHSAIINLFPQKRDATASPFHLVGVVFFHCFVALFCHITIYTSLSMYQFQSMCGCSLFRNKNIAAPFFCSGFFVDVVVVLLIIFYFIFFSAAGQGRNDSANIIFWFRLHFCFELRAMIISVLSLWVHSSVYSFFISILPWLPILFPLCAIPTHTYT